MKRMVLCLILLGCYSFTGKIKAQSLPTGTCGILYSYDATGNRTKREFVLNNSPLAVETLNINGMEVNVRDIVKVDALYPNPTTGQFRVRLVKPLQNATVTLLDMSGRIVFRQVVNGSTLVYNISSQPAGVYLLHIIQAKDKVTLKVLKK